VPGLLGEDALAAPQLDGGSWFRCITGQLKQLLRKGRFFFWVVGGKEFVFINLLLVAFQGEQAQEGER
jgi:hypothetical protein